MENSDPSTANEKAQSFVFAKLAGTIRRLDSIGAIPGNLMDDSLYEDHSGKRQLNYLGVLIIARYVSIWYLKNLLHPSRTALLSSLSAWPTS